MQRIIGNYKVLMVKKKLIYGLFGALLLLSIPSIVYIAQTSGQADIAHHGVYHLTQNLAERALDIHYENVVEVVFRMVHSMMAL